MSFVLSDLKCYDGNIMCHQVSSVLVDVEDSKTVIRYPLFQETGSKRWSSNDFCSRRHTALQDVHQLSFVLIGVHV